MDGRGSCHDHKPVKRWYFRPSPFIIIDKSVLPWRSVFGSPGRYSENSGNHDLHSRDTGDNYTTARFPP